MKLKHAELGKYGILAPGFDMSLLQADVPATSSEQRLAELIVRLFETRELLQRYASASEERIRHFDQNIFIEKYRRVIETVQ